MNQKISKVLKTPKAKKKRLVLPPVRQKQYADAYKVYKTGKTSTKALCKAAGMGEVAFNNRRQAFFTYFRRLDNHKYQSGAYKIKKGCPKKLDEKVNPLLKAPIIRMFGYCGYSLDKTAELIGCTRDTLSKYFKEHPEIKHEFLSGRDRANADVENALLRRAKGMKIKTTKFATHQGIISDEKEYYEELPPDTHAAEFWLINKSPDRWSRLPQGGVPEDSKTEYDIREGLYNENKPESSKPAIDD